MTWRNCPDPDAVVEAAASALRAFSTVALRLSLADVEAMSLRNRGGVTYVAHRSGQFLVATGCPPGRAKEADRYIREWRSREPVPVSSPPGAEPYSVAHGPDTEPQGVPLDPPIGGAPPQNAAAAPSAVEPELERFAHHVAMGDLERAEEALQELERGGADGEALPGSIRAILEGARAIRQGDAARGANALVALAAGALPDLARWSASFEAAHGLLARGDLDLAEQWAVQAFEWAANAGGVIRAASRVRLAESLLAGRRLSEARKHLQRARTEWHRLGLAGGVARVDWLEARLADAEDREADAMSFARRARGVDVHLSEPDLYLAAKAIARGQLASAQSRLAGLTAPKAGWMMRLAAEVRADPSRLDAARDLLELDQLPQPKAGLDRLLRVAASSPLPWSVAELVAEKAIATGRFEQARAACERALEQASSPEQRRVFERLLERVRDPDPRPGAQGTEPETGDAPRPVSVASTQGSAFNGDLGQFSIAELLEFLRASRRSGVLFCRGGDRVGVLHLSRGNIVDARLPSAEEAAAAAPPAPLDADPRAWEERERQVLAVLTELVEWHDGQFLFDPEPTEVGAPAAAGLDTQGLLLEVFRRIDEEGRQGSTRDQP